MNNPAELSYLAEYIFDEGWSAWQSCDVMIDARWKAFTPPAGGSFTPESMKAAQQMFQSFFRLEPHIRLEENGTMLIVLDEEELHLLTKKYKWGEKDLGGLDDYIKLKGAMAKPADFTARIARKDPKAGPAL